MAWRDHAEVPHRGYLGGARGATRAKKRRMRIIVPHNTDKETARRRLTERIAQLFGQYGHYLGDSSHQWSGDTLTFSGSAKGMKVNGTVEVTDRDIMIDGKLPLIAKPFESRIKSQIEKEAEEMFRA
jgi:hypothetical protein